MNGITTFLGKPVEYWIEAERRIQNDNLSEAIADLVVANAKLRFYEQTIDRLIQFKNAAEGMKK